MSVFTTSVTNVSLLLALLRSISTRSFLPQGRLSGYTSVFTTSFTSSFTTRRSAHTSTYASSGSFKKGLQTLPKTVQEKLGDRVRTQWKVDAHVCSRMLAYAHVCSRMLTYAGRKSDARGRRIRHALFDALGLQEGAELVYQISVNATTTTYVSSYYCMCPHTTTYASTYYCIRVRILLHTSRSSRRPGAPRRSRC